MGVSEKLIEPAAAFAATFPMVTVHEKLGVDIEVGHPISIDPALTFAFKQYAAAVNSLIGGGT